MAYHLENVLTCMQDSTRTRVNVIILRRRTFTQKLSLYIDKSLHMVRDILTYARCISFKHWFIVNHPEYEL